MSEKPPRQKDEKPDLLEQMIRNGPPPTLDAIAEHVADMVALEAIKEECADGTCRERRYTGCSARIDLQPQKSAAAA